MERHKCPTCNWYLDQIAEGADVAKDFLVHQLDECVVYRRAFGVGKSG